MFDTHYLCMGQIVHSRNELTSMAESLQRSSPASTASLNIRDALCRPVLFPTFVVVSLMVFQQWCGVNAIIFCTVTIFRKVYRICLMSAIVVPNLISSILLLGRPSRI